MKAFLWDSVRQAQAMGCVGIPSGKVTAASNGKVTVPSHPASKARSDLLEIVRRHTSHYVCSLDLSTSGFDQIVRPQ